MSAVEEVSAASGSEKEEAPAVEKGPVQEVEAPEEKVPEAEPAENPANDSSSKKAKKTKRVQIKKEEETKAEDAPVENGEVGEEEGGEEEDLGGKAPTVDLGKILAALMSVFAFFGGLFRKLWHGVSRGCLASCRVIAASLPSVAAVAAFAGLVYALAEYAVPPVAAPRYDDRLYHIARLTAAAQLPTALALLASRLRPASVPRDFVRLCLDDSLLLFLNTAVTVTYAPEEQLRYVSAVYAAATAYRFLLWFSRLYLSPTVQFLFSAPVQALHITQALYNAYRAAPAVPGWVEPEPVLEEPGSAWF